MKAWFVLPALAFCYSLRNESDAEIGQKFQLRSSIDVRWQANETNFEEYVKTEIEDLLCKDILSESDNCQLVGTGQ